MSVVKPVGHPSSVVRMLMVQIWPGKLGVYLFQTVFKEVQSNEMPHFNAHSQEDPSSQDSGGSFYKCLDQRPHCSRYIKIGNWAGQISPFIVFRVIAGCCDALRFMAPRDNSRFHVLL